MPDLPSDAEFLQRAFEKRLKDGKPENRNAPEGEKTKDWENQNYRNTDPSAGNGTGGVCEPQKLEVI